MGSCCSKPESTIIRVGTLEAGILGLQQILSGAQDMGITDDEGLKRELVALARHHGNYIAPSVEPDYQVALLREYKNYAASLQRQASQENAQSQKR